MVGNREVSIAAIMSALGQKQTFAMQNAMSALPLKADIRGRAKVSEAA